MTNQTDAKTGAAIKRQNLEGCYGKIGISAVLAALPYQSDAKNLAYAPVEPDTDKIVADLAA